MSDGQFNAGDSVYDRLGNLHQYVAPHPSGDGHICLPWFETRDEDGVPDNWTDAPVTLRTVYADAQSARLIADAKLTELTAKIDAARLELADLQQQQGVLNSGAKERLARLKQHDQLQLLDDYLAGKITHFVVVPEYSSTISVEPVDAALKVIDRHDKGLKLLTLYGDTNGELQFRINRYSDGSGSSAHDAYPFISEEAAKTFAKELAAQKLTACIKGGSQDGNGMPCGFAGWAKTAAQWGVPVPADLLARHRAVLISGTEKMVADREKTLAEANAYLAAVKGGAA